MILTELSLQEQKCVFYGHVEAVHYFELPVKKMLKIGK